MKYLTLTGTQYFNTVQGNHNNKLWSIICDENGHALQNSSKFSFAFGHLEHSFNDVILPLVVVIIAVIITYNI